MTGLLDYEQYMPHGMCLLWEPWLLLLWAGADLLIFLAYMAIPLALLLVLKRRPDIRHRGMVTLFASFILLCGVTHALSIVTLWMPIYPLMGTIKMMTGLVSLATAVALFRLIPMLVRIPTPDRHEELIAEQRATLEELTEIRGQLEERVQDRTEELKSANLRLALLARDAVQRSRNLIQVVSSLTQPGSVSTRDPARVLRNLRGRINALAIATSTIIEQTDQSTVRLERVIRRQIEPLFANPTANLRFDGPEIAIGAQGAQQLSLAVWELASRLVQSNGRNSNLPLICVDWRIEADAGKEQKLLLEWRETPLAKPLSQTVEIGSEADGEYSPPELSEFGEVLLTRIVPKLLSGSATIEKGDNLFVYQLECSLRTITEFGAAKALRGLENDAMNQGLMAAS